MSAGAVPPEFDLERLERAIGAALDWSASELERARKAGRFLTPAFPFVSKLYDEPGLAGLSAFQAAEVVGTMLRRRFSDPDAPSPWLALGDFDSFGNSVGDPLAAFVDNWDRYRPSPLRLAVRSADAEPLCLPQLAGDEWTNLRRFAATCAHLSVARKHQPFPVSVKGFGEALGLEARTISNYRRALESLGLLRQTSKAVNHKLAAEYVWTGPLPQRVCPFCAGARSISQGPAEVCIPCPKCGGSGRI